MTRRLVIGLAVGLGLASACVSTTHGIGSPTPAASGTVVDGIWPLVNGETLDLTALRGRVVVIQVFATWALGADADLDQLRDARALAPQQVTLVSLGVDADGARLLVPWRDAAGVDWPVALPTAEIVHGDSPFGDVMAAVPQTIVLDRTGRIVWRIDGAMPLGTLVGVVKPLLRK